MKVEDLSGDLLDYYVAMALGYSIYKRSDIGYAVYENSIKIGEEFIGYIGGDDVPKFAPHENWAQGGPLIKKFEIAFEHISGGSGGRRQWQAYFSDGLLGYLWNGDTHLIAAMRAIVNSKYGDTVPD